MIKQKNIIFSIIGLCLILGGVIFFFSGKALLQGKLILNNQKNKIDVSRELERSSKKPLPNPNTVKYLANVDTCLKYVTYSKTGTLSSLEKKGKAIKGLAEECSKQYPMIWNGVSFDQCFEYSELEKDSLLVNEFATSKQVDDAKAACNFYGFNIYGLKNDTQLIIGQDQIVLGGEYLSRENGYYVPIVDGENEARLNKLSVSIVQGSKTDYQKVDKLLGWIHLNFRHYVSNLPNPPYHDEGVSEEGTDVVDLFHYRTMGCHNDAGLLIAMLKGIGINAYDYSLRGHGVAYIPSLDMFFHGDSILSSGLATDHSPYLLSRDEFIKIMKDTKDKEGGGYRLFENPSIEVIDGDTSDFDKVYYPISEVHYELVEYPLNSNNFRYYFTTGKNTGNFSFDGAQALKKQLKGFLSDFTEDEIHIIDNPDIIMSEKHFYVITNQKPVKEFNEY